MNKRTWQFFVGVALLFAVFAVGYVLGFRAGTPDVRISPMDRVELPVRGGRVAIVYSRPYVRKRKIYGELVPYGKLWRTGANEATALHTDVDLVFGRGEEEARVPAGDYTLYTIPETNRWMLIINRQTGQWGTSYDEDQDLARIPMLVQTTTRPVEQFTIHFQPTPEGAELTIDWARTRAVVPFRLANM